jgi:very-short-patch-repair endonuclease
MLGPMPRDGAFLPNSSGAPGDWGEAHRIGAELPNAPAGGTGLGRNAPSDRAIVALAARQHGIVTTAQLLNAGVGRRSIARRVERGWLIPRFRGVYQVGPVAAQYGREMAAALACGEGAALSHQSAAAIWGFARDDDVVHVTVTRDVRSRAGLRVHRTLSLNAVVHQGLPLTDPARTLNDLERTLSTADIERARERAAMLGLVLPDDDPYPEFTRSEAEQRLKQLCKAAHLPTPRMNARVAGYEVDAYWPAHRLIVEIDGYAYHRTRAAFERDRTRDAALTAAGYRVIRITWRRLRDEPYSVSAQLGALLADARLRA